MAKPIMSLVNVNGYLPAEIWIKFVDSNAMMDWANSEGYTVEDAWSADGFSKRTNLRMTICGDNDKVFTVCGNGYVYENYR